MTLLAMRSGCDRKKPFCSDHMALMDFARTRSQIRATRKNKSAATQRNFRLGSEADVTAALMDVRFSGRITRRRRTSALCQKQTFVSQVARTRWPARLPTEPR